MIRTGEHCRPISLRWNALREGNLGRATWKIGQTAKR
jgi:hypothetical protein